ncbi:MULTISPECIES: DNA-directed RNA polymerase subunit alpha [Thermodesulfobacterium]|jgi:DNA-directed RNA polymerase subunit alpha|uniref:DNA-directed RNA polymerase subunit alpha n=2 Tax=Thermodesulfobacterium commune TaxID=1741 RepID=A0A075WT71_9BACT|nr:MULTISPECIES: DNA-directed RNA polymerase subunit alpha [Thermodesulfobacterium]KUJ98122.1 MAG: DNA-directed RNA polymerase subunit alpha [Thermodesulfobacterium sp. 37_54]KUK19768.1 MAG: DNA-directed RNA polymerase subunit alpha [Thermodesulfobacterium commune]AIH04210.1 DNA-directed RNA polymerase subunit alpha [Thermodesulfobacterium commune DSM 2178]KUK37891.1 MAG: DNA-directed RNA polymerase subunit alpha [Thermodesulfobacterium commune]MBZ4682255.1 DNA-directed polymerase subunit alph
MKREIELIKPEEIKVHKDSQFPYYGKFIIEPLERGYGITLGNALRRVLLSSIPGYSITEVRIEGAPHEFTSLPGVVEDVTEIILNLKGVRFKLEGDGPFYFKLEKIGEGEVKAGDIQVEDKGIIVNPDAHIATLTKDGKLVMEIKVEKGRGYVPAEYNKNNEIGVILVDGLFSPITKVNFTVTQARVGKSSDYDSLVLEIYTDGTIDPKEALVKAAKILVEQFMVFLGEEKIGLETTTADVSTTQNILNLPIEELELSGRAYNCLKAANINYIGQLVQKTESELLKLRSFGKKSLDEIVEKLNRFNLKLGMTDLKWKPPKD